MKNKICQSYICILFLLIFNSCASRSTSESRLIMDTVCTITLFEDGKQVLYDKIWTRLEEIENEFSVTKDGTEIYKINQSAGMNGIQVSSEVRSVLEYSKFIAKLTDGAFNPCAGALIDLWGINTENAHLPSKAKINEAKKHCDYNSIQIEDNEIFLTDEKAGINLGGIVKGYACDEVVKILKASGVHKAVVDLGGNIYVFGKKADGQKWKVGIKNPADPLNDPLLKVETDEISVVTSGVYERFFEQNGKRYHHIIDVKKGFPAENGLLSVTVLSSSSMLCDSLSTALFVLGKDKSLKLLPQLERITGQKICVIFIDSKLNYYNYGSINPERI